MDYQILRLVKKLSTQRMGNIINGVVTNGFINDTDTIAKPCRKDKISSHRFVNSINLLPPFIIVFDFTIT